MSARVTARTVLICTDCHAVWEPDLTDPNGHTGCHSCGGWTWIGEIAEPAERVP
jgi:hypothetical protein